MRYIMYFLVLIILFFLLMEVSGVRQVTFFNEERSGGVVYDVAKVEWHWERLGSYLKTVYTHSSQMIQHRSLSR